jgi:hypothetical protein
VTNQFVASSETEMNSLKEMLLKKLNDSLDTIRIEIARAIKDFIQLLDRIPNFPSSSKDPIQEEFTKQLVIHLDDLNPLVQEAMFEALSAIGEINPKLIVDQVQLVQAHHRNPEKYCNSLLATFSQKQ